MVLSFPLVLVVDLESLDHGGVLVRLVPWAGIVAARERLRVTTQREGCLWHLRHTPSVDSVLGAGMEVVCTVQDSPSRRSTALRQRRPARCCVTDCTLVGKYNCTWCSDNMCLWHHRWVSADYGTGKACPCCYDVEVVEVEHSRAKSQ